MKSDAKIRFKDNVDINLLGIEGRNITFSYDMDYCEDPDDVICDIEEQIYNKYGFCFHYNVDFEIENFSEICEDFQ